MSHQHGDCTVPGVGKPDRKDLQNGRIAGFRSAFRGHRRHGGFPQQVAASADRTVDDSPDFGSCFVHGGQDTGKQRYARTRNPGGAVGKDLSQPSRHGLHFSRCGPGTALHRGAANGLSLCCRRYTFDFHRLPRTAGALVLHGRATYPGDRGPQGPRRHDIKRDPAVVQGLYQADPAGIRGRSARGLLRHADVAHGFPLPYRAEPGGVRILGARRAADRLADGGIPGLQSRGLQSRGRAARGVRRVKHWPVHILEITTKTLQTVVFPAPTCFSTIH